MKNFTKIFVLVLGLLSISYAQDMLNINDFNFQSQNYNTSYIATDSASLNISTVVSAANAVQNSNKFHFLLHGSIGKHGLGVGAKVNTSFYKIFQTTTAELLLAKRIKVGENNRLNFGLNAGLILNSLKQDKINQYTDIQDPVIQNGTYNKIGFMAGIGLSYNWKNRLDIGASLPVLVQSIHGVAPVFFTNISYNQRISDKMSIKPGLLIYGPNYIAPTYEGNVILEYKNVAWLKLGGRSTKSILFGAGGSVNFISFGYMYNMVLGNEFAEAYTGAHNVQVAFHFLAKKDNVKTNVVD